MAVSVVIVLVVAVGVVVLVTSSDGDGDDDVAADEVAADSDTTTTTEPSTTTEPETGLPGEEFVDPEGVYTMNVDPEWVSSPGGLQGMEIWMVGQSTGDRSNLSLLTAMDGGGDLSTYMDGLLRGVGVSTDNVNEVGREVVEGAGGQELGLLEITGSQAGQPLHFLMAIIMESRTVVAATLTSTPETFHDVRAAVEPYLLTLEFADCSAATLIPCP